MASTAIIREFLQITQESAFGVKVSSPSRGTNQIVIRLPGSDQYTVRPNPIVQDMPYGAGFSVIADTISDKTEIKGNLSTPLTYSQANFLLGWGAQRINSGQTTPWVTTEPPFQFASCTIEHGIMYDDNAAILRKAYTGMKVDSFKVDVSEESQYAMFSAELVGGDYAGNPYDGSSDPTATPFPLPADNEFPTDFVLFIHSAGGLTLGSATRTEYTNLSIAAQNQSDVRYYAKRFVQNIRSFGSMYTIDCDLTLVHTPDDRASLEQILAQAASVAFTNVTNTLTLQFNANNRIKSLTDTLPIGKIYGRKLSMTNRYDRTAGAWFGYTFA